MSIAGLLVTALMAVIAIAIVARPLLQARRGRGPVEDSQQLQKAQLRIYYQRVLTNIRDLDEDFATGKLSANDHQAEREFWVQRGIRLLRLVDELEHEPTNLTDAGEAERIDSAIEAAVAAYRESGAVSMRNTTDEDRP